MAQSILEESKKARRGFLGSFFAKKKILFFLVVLLIVGGVYYFYNRQTSSSIIVVQPKKATVKKEDLKIAVQSEGKVVAKDGVELSFPVSGNLEVSEVSVKEGDKIKKGDKIAAVKTESLEFELRSAYASYQSALSNFNLKQAGATDSELSKSKAAVDQAQVSVDQAKISLEKVKASAATQITDAETALETATDNLNRNQSVNNSELVRSAYTNLAVSLKSISISLQKILRDSDSVLGIDESTLNDDFELGLGVKDSSTLSAAQSSYAQAKVAKQELEALTAYLDSNNMTAVDQAAAKARVTLPIFQNHLYDLQNLLDATITLVGFSQTDLDSLKSTVSADRSSVNSAISSLATIVQSASDSKNNLKQYQIAYNKAVSDLAEAKSQAEQDINNSTISLHSREISLGQAKLDYTDLLAPTLESDLASARSQLTSAAISVDRAKYNMEQATLVSPIDGIVAMLNYKQGDIILSDSAKSMATIINNDTLFIEVNIEEADISKLKVGQKAQATFEAVDGLVLNGEVSFISLTSSTSANGIVTYLVRIILTNTGETQIREGMTASVDFILAGASNVLAVPVDAVRNINGQPAVELIDGSVVNVVTGFTDGKKVEIISGLKVGDVVVY